MLPERLRAAPKRGLVRISRLLCHPGEPADGPPTARVPIAGPQGHHDGGHPADCHGAAPAQRFLRGASDALRRFLFLSQAMEEGPSA